MRTTFLFTTLILTLFFVLPVFATQGKYPVDSYPEKVIKSCRGGAAKIYDECGDQRIILNDALETAKKSKKSVLVVYGAEWCIWCHVFDKYIKGQSRFFNYEWEYENRKQRWLMFESENRKAGKQAIKLNKFVSENFVVAHIEGHYAPNGKELVLEIGAEENQLYGVPFIFVLDRKGNLATAMKRPNELKGLLIRDDNGREYRGYNRKILLSEMKRMRRVSLKKR